jgi:catechol 2,3-dioxygenase-like lactoylglutathione lyase family enzyme
VAGLTGAAPIAFVPTARPAAARAFYRDLLGLPLLDEDGFALVLDAGGTMLRVVRVEAVAPAAHTVLGWRVADIHATLSELHGKGVQAERFGFLEQDADGVWAAPGGDLVAWFKDPDGNTLSLTQFRA